MKRADFVTEKVDFPARATLTSPCRTDEKKEALYDFRAVLIAKNKPCRVLMIVTASDYVSVVIGGDTEADFALRSYVYHRAYEVYDVTDAICAGENEIVVRFVDSRAPINRGFVCEFIVDGARATLEWTCREVKSRNYVPHYISGGGFEIYDATIAEGEFLPCESKKYEFPSGVDVYQSIQTPQEKREIHPERSSEDETIERFDGEYYKFRSGEPSIYFSDFFTASGEKMSLKAVRGVHSFYVDGNEINNSSPVALKKGRHVICVFSRGGECAFMVKSGAALIWHVAAVAEEKVPYRYPWNDFLQVYKIPNETREMIKNIGTARVLPNAPAAERVTAPSHSDILAFEGKRVTFDFGRERVGRLKIEIGAPQGARIYFRMFELVSSRGPRDMGERSGGMFFAEKGKNSFTSARLRGFRYAEICVPDGVEISDLRVLLIEEKYSAKDVGAFASNDKKLDEIYKISLDTADVCMLDSYVDCPGYEQNTWVGDAAITGMINMISFGAREFDVRYLDAVAHSMATGLRTYYRGANPLYVNDTYLPCACFPTYPDGGIPIWSFSWVNHVCEHIMHFGAGEGTAELLGAVEECLRRAETHFSPRGLFAPLGAWNLIEWANNDLSPYGEVTANNIMLCECYTNVSNLFKLLGDGEKASIYLEKSKKLKENINKYCWDDVKIAYVDTVRDEAGYLLYLDFCKFKNRTPEPYENYLSAKRVSVQTATFAVLFGIADGARREACERMLIEDMTRGNFRAGTPAKRTLGLPTEDEAPGGIVRIGTPFFLYYALGALCKIGRHDIALDVMRREWGAMIDDGLLTCVETFKNADGEWGRSVAHAWSAAPAVYLKTEILGVKPLDIGYRKFTVDPHPCGLTRAVGAVPTPYGNITVKWRVEGGKTVVDVDAPRECERI